MNEKVAMIFSVEASVLSIIVSFWFIDKNIPSGGGANIFLTLVLISFVSGVMGLFIQFKKEKANLQNVVFVALFNFVGIGICTYALLTGKYENA